MPVLLRHPALTILKRGRARISHVSNTYFDSPDFRLQRDGISLRVRRIGRRFLQTLKGPPQSGAGLHMRAEHEWPLRTGVPDVSLIAATPWKKLVMKAQQDGELIPVCTADYERRTLALEFPDGTRAQMCADRGQVRALRGGRVSSAPISEVEIELVSGDIANLFRLGLAFAADLPVAVLAQSKAERGYALRRGLRATAPMPVHAGEITLEPEAATTEALSVIARECLRQVAANAPGLVTEEDPEWVHQMRVGTRRLRSCLTLMKPFCAEAKLEPATAEVKWLATLLGDARDWDVFVTETLPPLAAWFARDTNAAPGIKRLRDRAARRRREARKRAREGVASLRFQRLLLAAGLIAATPRLGAAGEGNAARNPPSGDSEARASVFAAKLLNRRHRKFADLAQTLEHAGNDERHAARIAAKRLRYVAEFFSPLFPGKRTRTYVETLAAAQDALGQFNDAVTAGNLAGELSGSTDAAATGAVRGWVAAQAAAIEPRLEKAVRRFNAAKPFWSQR
jgi:inorganic triphosphatase YgiF